MCVFLFFFYISDTNLEHKGEVVLQRVVDGTLVHLFPYHGLIRPASHP